ncbi:MAG: type pilus assembly protein PilC, partial [Thermoanaerobacterium sp.]|nr:type pilus assembly protein PilC [Thermoanaerobacterium sp.]
MCRQGKLFKIGIVDVQMFERMANMPTYIYKAKDIDGNLITGSLELDTLSSCIDNLRQKNYYILDVKEKEDKKDVFERISFARKVKVKDIAVFCRQFAVLINAGIPIVTSLATMAEQVENKKLKKALSDVYEDVQKGKSLSESMRKHPDVFPMLLFNMIEAGEVSGTLDNVLNEMADHFEKENNLIQKVKSALAYPMIVSIVAILVVIFLVTNVLPTFVSMFKNAGAQLPTPTLILLWLSESISHYWYVYLGGILLLTFMVTRVLKTERGRKFYDALMLKIPIFGPLNIKIITSRFTRTLSTLISSGIPLIEALSVVERVVGNSIVANGLKKAEEDIKRGSSLAEPLKKMNIFPPMVIQMV